MRVKIHHLIGQVAFLAWLAVMALDAVRFRGSHVPLWLKGFGRGSCCARS
jgi:hypothetical protein